jgi:hypothetical protein
MIHTGILLVVLYLVLIIKTTVVPILRTVPIYDMVQCTGTGTEINEWITWDDPIERKLHFIGLLAKI